MYDIELAPIYGDDQGTATFDGESFDGDDGKSTGSMPLYNDLFGNVADEMFHDDNEGFFKRQVVTARESMDDAIMDMEIDVGLLDNLVEESEENVVNINTCDYGMVDQEMEVDEGVSTRLVDIVLLNSLSRIFGTKCNDWVFVSGEERILVNKVSTCPNLDADEIRTITGDIEQMTNNQQRLKLTIDDSMKGTRQSESCDSQATMFLSLFINLYGQVGLDTLRRLNSILKEILQNGVCSIPSDTLYFENSHEKDCTHKFLLVFQAFVQKVFTTILNADMLKPLTRAMLGWADGPYENTQQVLIHRHFKLLNKPVIALTSDNPYVSVHASLEQQMVPGAKNLFIKLFGNNPENYTDEFWTSLFQLIVDDNELDKMKHYAHLCGLQRSKTADLGTLVKVAILCRLYIHYHQQVIELVSRRAYYGMPLHFNASTTKIRKVEFWWIIAATNKFIDDDDNMEDGSLKDAIKKNRDVINLTDMSDQDYFGPTTKNVLYKVIKKMITVQGQVAKFTSWMDRHGTFEFNGLRISQDEESYLFELRDPHRIEM